MRRAASSARPWRAGRSSGASSRPEPDAVSAALPEVRTGRLLVRLARPGMERAIAHFLRENFPGHLDRWSPPVGPAFFTEAFWAERLLRSLGGEHARGAPGLG